MKKLWLNLGCGITLAGAPFTNIDNYVTLKEIEQGARTHKGPCKDATIGKGAKFVKADVCHLPFKDNSVDYIESISMVEHLPIKDMFTFFAEVKRVLKPGHSAVIMTNDFGDVARMYLEELDKEDLNAERFRDINFMIYGNQAHDGEYHHVAHSPYSFHKLQQEAGFKKLNLTYYPRYCSVDPKVKTMGWKKGAMFTCAQIKGEFIK